DVRELIRRCHDTVVGAAANQDVPFGLVVEALNPERVQGRNPLFQIGFLLQAAAVSGGDLDLGGLAVAEINTSADRSRFDLSAVIVEQADSGLELTVEYSTELFDVDRIARLAEHFSAALAQLTTDPGIRISQCEVIAEAERARLLGWGEGQRPTGHRVYVLDERLRLAPIGIPGHLYRTSAGIAQDFGYPDVAADNFLPDPYSPAPGGLMYATGDLACWHADGNLEYLGRIDRQAKIRGLRIDLGKIEQIVGNAAAVRETLVVVKQAGTPQARLVGYLVPEPGHDVDLDQARERLNSQLPAHLQPVTILTLPSLPLSADGEIDLTALPDPEDQPDAGDAALATDTQRLLAGAWRSLLGADAADIGSHDSFFGLGGNSLWIALLVVKIRDLFQVRLDPGELFTYPELGQLAARIDQLIDLSQGHQDRERPGEPASPLAQGSDLITAVARGGHLPCSYQQEGLWLLYELDPFSPGFHLPVAIRISGELDLPALSHALTALVARHESLRTRFDDAAGSSGVPFQVIDAPSDAWPLPVAELPAGGEVSDWIRAEVSRRFDLRTGPVFRSSVLRIAPDDHALVLVLHRMVADDWSVAVLAGELSRAYDAARSGLTAPLPELAIQPADYAAWQRQRSLSGGLDRQLDYWTTVLGNLEEAALPADRCRLPRSASTDALLARRFAGGLVAAVRELARAEQVSLLAVLLAGFLVVLNRYTGQRDLAVGTVFSGRTRTEVEPLIGYFAQTLVLRTSLAG
ncbi:MAG TPA: condensation domain-containing protein, partial [Streptosporangiaceae bacterium]|nr:condensation domain-containing protein [Streptosporangiaceae bacterium]